MFLTADELQRLTGYKRAADQRERPRPKYPTNFRASRSPWRAGIGEAMTLKFTPDGKASRLWDGNPEYVDEVLDALDECVAALRECSRSGSGTLDGARCAAIATDTLRKIEAEP